MKSCVLRPLVSRSRPASLVPSTLRMPVSLETFLSVFPLSTSLKRCCTYFSVLASWAPYRKYIGVFSLTACVRTHDSTGALKVPSVGLMLSQIAQLISLPPLPPLAGSPAGNAGAPTLRSHSVAIHRAPSDAPDSAPITITLEELHSWLSLRVSR